MGKEVTLTTLYHDMVETQHQVNQNFALLIQVNSETKKELRTEMQTGFEMQKNEFAKVRTEMKEMKEELRGEMSQMKEELRAEMNQMKEDIYVAMKQMKTEIISEVGEVIQETLKLISQNHENGFQNHEKRIVYLEELNGISNGIMSVHEPDPPPYE